MSIFSEGTNRQIPGSIEECKKADPICEELRGYSEQIHKNGIIAWIIIGLLGIVLGIMIGENISTEIGFAIAIIGISFGGFVYSIFRTIAIFIIANASMVQSLKITSNVLLYNTSRENKSNITNTTSKSDAPCRPDNSYKKSISELAREADRNNSIDDRWICKHCLTKNQQSAAYCIDCGKHR